MNPQEPPRRRALKEAFKRLARALSEVEAIKQEAAEAAAKPLLEEVEREMLQNLYKIETPKQPPLEELKERLENALGAPLDEALKTIKSKAPNKKPSPTRNTEAESRKSNTHHRPETPDKNPSKQHQSRRKTTPQ